MLSPSFLLLALWAQTASSALVSKTIHVADKIITAGGFAREATLVDGQFPGPVIKGNKARSSTLLAGDKFEITVANDLVSNSMYKVTSIHWHGIHMHHTTWADGSATVSQCPLIPQESFKYVWDTSAKGSPQAGTFWYHSHFSAQYCDGLRGPLVIRDDAKDKATYKYDIDTDARSAPCFLEQIISLGDWFMETGKSFHPGPGVFPFIPDSIVINGKGIYYNETHPTLDKVAVVQVQPNKKYRMRVIQMACYTAFDYSIDGHKLTVIEADSILTKPYTVDQITISAGQRYSHILDTHGKTPDAYWIRAQPERLKIKYDIRNATNATETVPYWKHNTNVAILRYTNSPRRYPQVSAETNVPEIKAKLDESKLVPLKKGRAPGKAAVGRADVNINLVSTFDSQKDGLFRINNASFVGPRVPVLLQILNGNWSANDLLPPGSVYTLPRNKVIEVRIKGTSKLSGGPHPFHLHGHDFYIIKSAGSNKYNFNNPMQRDTISTGLEGDEAIIRFRSDNPGPWFLHCHLDWHLDMGMGIVFAEDPKHTKADNKPSAEWNQLCQKYDDYIAAGGENRIDAA